MSLHSGISVIIKQHQQSWNNSIVEFLLKDGSEICRHLSDGIARSISNPWMGILQVFENTLHDSRNTIHYLRKHVLHVLVAALPNRAERHQRSMTLLPVKIAQHPWYVLDYQW